ncbi:unnamed protein product [Didymodactylos carnosus]|uniref:CCHC-type domain-containing protein n=1 Tax=Didymodactylos carnosus TaxID=1234261 RepID=A0A814E8S3_9BILA|nr:unnamed protein product [Didymodactylos carnosus]CAF1057141.1 unnamed protein product [Didymodactylos carnosus]CAF3739667.1 unnamed protein product [Didymodactylos carnosus]CAF3823156.1 unnamed protein product [Didymodactylos carnosus]
MDNDLSFAANQQKKSKYYNKNNSNSQNYDSNKQRLQDNRPQQFNDRLNQRSSPKSYQVGEDPILKQGHQPPYKASNYQMQVAVTSTKESNINQLNHQKFQMDHLKRAVTHNLPCFFVQFDSNLQSRDYPSAVKAGNDIYKHLIGNNVKINKFSLVSYAGKQLKSGVNNKNDLYELHRTDKWPNTVMNKNVKIVKPKSIASHFSLVLRYVPNNIPDDFVFSEIKKSINSAEKCHSIVYAYARTKKDYRFNVGDLEEYHEALNLGSIAVGNYLLPVTPYLPANKLTYCSKCFKLGHIAVDCQSQYPSCRVCLHIFDNNHKNQCDGRFKCAQCGGNHFSLDGNCQMVQNYRLELNKAVKQAIEKGELNYDAGPLRLKQTKQNDYRYEENTFPLLVRNDRFGENHWKIQQNNNNHNYVENKKDWIDILTKLDTKTDQMVNEIGLINKKLDKQVAISKRNETNIVLNKVITTECISILVGFIKDIGKPVAELVTNDKGEITKIIDDYAKKLLNIEERLRMNFQFEDMPMGPDRTTTNDEVNSDMPMNNNSLLTTMIPNQNRVTSSVEIEVRNGPEENTNIVSSI